MSELGEHISLDLLSEDEKPVVLVVDDNIEMLTYLEESLSNYFTVITGCERRVSLENSFEKRNGLDY